MTRSKYLAMFVALCTVGAYAQLVGAQEMSSDEVLPPETQAIEMQALPPTLDRTWAYTTSDPVRPDLLGLATVGGRYSILLSGGCQAVTDGQEVALYVVAGGAWIAPLDAAGGLEALACPIQVQAQRSAVPCFTDERGVCAVGQETDPH